MHITESALEIMDRYERINLINSLSGIKSANLIGTSNDKNKENLAIFSSVVHLGSNPALFGFILRPQGEVPRNTFENIKSSGVYTINFISTDFIKEAHYTSIKVDADINEFELTGLTSEYWRDFKAPFVKESTIKLGMLFIKEIPIEINGTSLIIGKVKHIIIPDESLMDGGHLNFEEQNIAGIGGLNTYYSLKKEARFPYVRESMKMADLD